MNGGAWKMLRGGHVPCCAKHTIYKQGSLALQSCTETHFCMRLCCCIHNSTVLLGLEENVCRVRGSLDSASPGGLDRLQLMI